MKKIALSLGFLLFAAGVSFAQTDLQVLTVVKLSKPESITVKQLKARCETFEKQIGRKLSVDEKKEVLNSLVDEKLVLQAAAKAGVSVTDSVVDQTFIQQMSQSVGANVTEKELNDALVQQTGKTLDQTLREQTGMGMTEYKAYLKSQLTLRQYVISQKQEEIQKVAATDEEIKMAYEASKATFVWSDMIKLFMVVVPKGSDPDAALTKINDLHNKLVDKKMTSDQITVQARIDGSGYSAGDLLIPKTEAGAATLGLSSYQALLFLFQQDDGYVSDLNETRDDYRFVSVQKKYGAKMLSLLDLVQPESNMTVYDYIRSNLTYNKQMQYINVAAQEISKTLHVPENVEEKKSGDALNKLLSWGE